MIKCNVQVGKRIQVKAKGDLATVTKEFLCITAEIYNGLKKSNKSAADEFRNILFAALIDPNSPVLNPEKYENTSPSENLEKSLK